MDHLIAEALAFLDGMARDLVSECSVLPGAAVPGAPSNATGGTLVRPGGRDCYPSFWIRDFALSMESGLFPRELVFHALRVTALSQNDALRLLPSGAQVPEGAIADHVNFDSQPIYFPGTYDPAAQGGEPWGLRPSLDDHFYFARMAAFHALSFGEPEILRLPIRGRSLLERLEAAFASVPTARGSELVACGDADRAVNFGFMDSVRQTGSLLFASLLRCVAARDLAKLEGLSGKRAEERRFSAVAAAIRGELASVFGGGTGLLRASTARSAQSDVWGSAFAVSAALLPKDCEEGVCAALLAAYRGGRISWRGNIRHVPVGEDFSADSAWEDAVPRLDSYQNGAYWGTPVGWVVDALSRVDACAARELFLDYIEELREGDFRRGASFDSPVECMHPRGGYRQNPLYLASVAAPLPVLRRVFGRA